ncbi:ribulose-phosphate 3-epimerase [Georgenia wangjunii]|uniref:ribulose-phosphate 3-epimerase n=1 Tax=Georgenia wangjunii TaxID=3117730 RepID=UPI002F261C2D
MINAPSLANSNLLDLGEDLDALVRGGCRTVHVDVMDGHYVPNLCFPVSAVAAIKDRYPDLVVDAHLMVDTVEDYIEPLRVAGCDAMSFPIDATRFVRRTLSTIQAAGMRAGVAINPSQDVAVVEPVLRYADYVVLMSVEPGFAGQTFLDGSLDRLDTLASLREATGSSALIQIDGGVTYDVAEEGARRGAEIFVTGVFTVYDPELSRERGMAEFDSRMARAGYPASSEHLAALRRTTD